MAVKGCGVDPEFSVVKAEYETNQVFEAIVRIFQ
jgi:hypothetical protein